MKTPRESTADPICGDCNKPMKYRPIRNDEGRGEGGDALNRWWVHIDTDERECADA